MLAAYRTFHAGAPGEAPGASPAHRVGSRRAARGKFDRPLARLLLVFCLGSSPALAAETQTVVRQTGMLLTVEGWLLTRADRDSAWAVLTDYARFPEFVPGIFSNRVLESGNGVRLIEQRGEVVAGQLRMPYDGTMRVEEQAGRGLRIRFQSGLFKDVQGEWQIQPGPPLKLTYQMRMDLTKTAFPPAMAPAMAEFQVRTWVEALGREMEQKLDRNMERRQP